MKSKVTVARINVDQNTNAQRTWPYNGKVYFDYWIEMEDGTKGVYSSITPNTQLKFIVGREVEYEYEQKNPEYPGKIKPAKTFSGGGNYKQSDPRSFAASYAKDIIVAGISQGSKVNESDFDRWADHIYKWMKNEVPVTAEAPKKEQKVNDVSSDVNDDLPF